MQVLLNSKTINTSARTLAEMAAEQAWQERGIAVGLNNRLVPRNEWPQTTLNENDKLVVVKAAAGG